MAQDTVYHLFGKYRIRKAQCGGSDPAALNIAVDFFTIRWYNQFNKSEFERGIQMKDGKYPNPNTIHPIAGYDKEIYVKPTITNPNIIVGDFTYGQDERDAELKYALDKLKPTILCIHGNHEIRPWHIPTYKTKEWHGGIVWYEEAYPSVLFAKDGEIYALEGLRHIVIGGAYSVDKFYRLSRGYGWWSDEQPSEEIKQYVEQQLKENAIDVVLSHTCPFKYEPVEEFLPGIDQSTVDDSTEKWLDVIEETTDYMAWFCGHWHTNKRIDKMHFLFHQFESSEELQKMKVNKTNLEREMEDG